MCSASLHDGGGIGGIVLAADSIKKGDEVGLSALVGLGSEGSWGVAPGWYGVAPLGLAKAGMVSHRWCWRGLAGFFIKGAGEGW